MRCILEGHDPQRHPGQGRFSDQEFDICVHCGKTWPVVGGVRAQNAVYAKPPYEDGLPQVHRSDA